MLCFGEKTIMLLMKEKAYQWIAVDGMTSARLLTGYICLFLSRLLLPFLYHYRCYLLK